MKQVQTVRGPVEAASLGATLMHEHLLTKNPELENDYPSPEWDEDAVMEGAREGLKRLKALGISTLVDVTVMGIGRDIGRIARLAEGLDINIVVATGYYTWKDLPAYFGVHGPGLLIDDGVDPLERMFRRDIVDGIGDSGIKAGIIKVATDRHGITPDIERILRAAARVQIETGVPVTTHSHAASHGGREQQEFFRREGVELSNVVIGHCGDTTDLVYLRELMDNGSTIGMDRFGLDTVLPLDDRVRTVATLCAEGYADRMTLSHDAAYFSINIEPSFRRTWEPRWHHELVSEEVLPRLRKLGVSDEQITQMMVTNPMRVLGVERGRYDQPSAAAPASAGSR